MIYVASSWKNPLQTAVCAALKSAGLEHYDFKGEGGFHWSEIDVVSPEEDLKTFMRQRELPRAYQGYIRDFTAMQQSDTFVLVLPCGRSAHLELGWAVGQGKRTAILMDDPCTPELMYHMVDYLAPDLFSLLGWLGVVD